jgi:hypothetical protein
VVSRLRCGLGRVSLKLLEGFAKRDEVRAVRRQVRLESLHLHLEKAEEGVFGWGIVVEPAVLKQRNERQGVV